MARGLNKVLLIGNLGADPEVRYTQSNTAVTNFSVATTETWKDKATGETRELTEWHRCVAYRRLAEIAGEFLRKGSKVYIEGKNQTRSYTPNDGIERFTTEIVVNDLQLLDRPSHDDGDERRRQHEQKSMAQTRTGLGSPMPGPAPQRQPAAKLDDDFQDDDIPF